MIWFFGLYEKLIQVMLQPVFYKEKKYSYFNRRNERPVEYAFAFKCIAEIYPENLLDVGTGTSAFTHLVDNCGIKTTSIDKISGYWNTGMSNRHVKVIHDDITNSNLKNKFDIITCISVIEHIPEYNKAVNGMVSLLKPGGHLILTFPYNEHAYHPDIYRDPRAAYGQKHKFIGQIFSRMEITKWIEQDNLEIIQEEFYCAFSGDLWATGNPVYPVKRVEKSEKHHLCCLLLKKN